MFLPRYPPSSGVCQTRDPAQNFELRHLLNPLGSPVLIPLSVNYTCNDTDTDENDYISHSTNTLGVGMNPIILPPAMGK